MNNAYDYRRNSHLGKSSFIAVIQLKGETNILYRLITCKVRYFKPFFVTIGMIMAYENHIR